MHIKNPGHSISRGRDFQFPDGNGLGGLVVGHGLILCIQLAHVCAEFLAE